MPRRFDHARGRARKAERAAELSALGQGRLTPSEAVLRPPGALSGADLWDVLLRCPGLGRESVRTVCERSGVWPHTKLGEMTLPQREAVVAALPARAREDESPAA